VTNLWLRLFLLAGVFAAPAQNAVGELTVAGVEEFKAAYQAWDAGRFAAAADSFRQATLREPTNGVNFYWLGVAEFHRMLQLRGAASIDTAAAAAMDSALAALQAAVRLDAHAAESHALLGTIYGMKINGSILRAAWFGPRVAQHRAAALKSGADNPRVQYLLGMCQFHTAKGAADWREALATLQRAAMLFQAEGERPAAPGEPRWGRDSCLTFAGLACENLGQRAEAANYFHQALGLHPLDSLARAGLARLGALP
jgi:tetratricopeptide (TPR) repeat protein